MATPPIGTPLSEDLVRKLWLLRDCIDAGLVQPDPIQCAWASSVLKDAGELALARDFERIARRLLPLFQRDLS